MTGPAIFPELAGQQYVSLNTFRKSGEAVATPVWFAVEGDRLFIVTQDDSGKVKRIRNNPRVTMTPSDAQGKLVSGASTVEGLAVITPLVAGERGDRALRAKYGWMYQAFGLFWRVRRITAVLLEVRVA
ncbi:MAG: PPOX class F420-dependent oxidoreductase [Oscillochloridaceae bacterium umkhey_bin13]